MRPLLQRGGWGGVSWFTWSLDFRCKISKYSGISTSDSPNLTISKTSRYSNPVYEFMYQHDHYVNIIVYIWYPNLGMCVTAKNCLCTRLVGAMQNLLTRLSGPGCQAVGYVVPCMSRKQPIYKAMFTQHGGRCRICCMAPLSDWH